MKIDGKRRLKIAMVLGALGIVAAWALFIASPQHQIASGFLHGPQLRSFAGETEFSFPASFRLAGDRSSMTYYVFGSRRRGVLRVVLEKSDGGTRVKSAIFDQVPLSISSDGEKGPTP